MGPEDGDSSHGSDTSAASSGSQSSTIHWCPKNERQFDHVIFFNKFSAGQLREPVPDELLCLNKCWKCVQEYYHSRKKYLEGSMSHTEGVLYTFECIVLRHFLTSLSQKLRQNKQINELKNPVKSPPKEQTKSLPIIVKQILQYPFFLFMREIHDAFIEVLVELLREQSDHYNVSKFPGLYLLLIHPNETVHTWAKEVVKNFCPIELGDSSDLLRAANLVLSVLKFNLQTDPILCDNLGLEEPSCRIIIMSHLFSMDVYWHGLQTLLNHMDGDLVRKVHPEIPQTILSSLLEAAASSDPDREVFLRKLSCFVVVLKSLKEDIWSQVTHSREDVFLSIIKCKAWSEVLERICRNINAPNSFSLVFNWITHWASSLGGSQSSRYTHTQYCAVYAYHVLSLVQHRLFHLQPKVELYSSCRGLPNCKFCQFKHRERNKLTIDLDLPFLRNVECLTTLMRITRNLLRGNASSKGIAIPPRMKPSHAGFLTYGQIVKLILCEQRNKMRKPSVSETSSDTDQNNSNIQSSKNSVSGNKTVSQETRCDGEAEVQTLNNLSESEQPNGHHSKGQSNTTTSTPTSVRSPTSAQSRQRPNLSKHSRLSLSHQDGNGSKSKRRNSGISDSPHMAGEDKFGEKDSENLNSSSRNLTLMLKKINRDKGDDMSTTSRKTPTSKSYKRTTGTNDSKEPTSSTSTPSTLESPHDRLKTTVRLDRKGRISSQDARRLKLRKCFIQISHQTLRTQKTEQSPTFSEDNEDVCPPRKRARPLSSDSEVSDCEMDTSAPHVQTETVSNEVTSTSSIGRSKVVDEDDETDLEKSDEDNMIEREKHVKSNSRGHERVDSSSDSDLPDISLDREEQSISEQLAIISAGEETEEINDKPQKEDSAKKKKTKHQEEVTKQQQQPPRNLFEKGDELEQRTGELEKLPDDHVSACSESPAISNGDDGSASAVAEGAKKIEEEMLKSPVSEDNDILEVKVIDEPLCFVISSDDEEEEDNEKKEESRKDPDDMDNRKEPTDGRVEPAPADTVPTSKGPKMSSFDALNAQPSEKTTMTVHQVVHDTSEGSTSMGEGPTLSSEQNKTPQSAANSQSARVSPGRTVNILSRKSHQSPQRKGKCSPSDCNACKNHEGKHRVRPQVENVERKRRKMVHEVRSDEAEDDAVFLETGWKEREVGEEGDHDIQADEPNGTMMEEEDGDWEIEEEEKSLSKVLGKFLGGGEECNSVDSDAETDDGTGMAEEVRESSLDFLDEVLMKEDTTKQLSEVAIGDDDGNSSDGLELSEIIDHTESFFTNPKDIGDKAGGVKGIWDGQDNGHLGNEVNQKLTEVEAAKSRRDSEAEMVDDEGGEENPVFEEKGSELIMDILNCVSSGDQEEEEDDEDGDGWLEDDREGDDEMEDGGEKDDGGWLSDDSEEHIEPSQGFHVSEENVEVRDMRRRVLTGGLSGAFEEDVEPKGKKLSDSGIPGETEEEGHSTGIKSKSFYTKKKVAKASKKLKKRKTPPFNGYHAHARMKNMQRKLSEIAKNAVPLGHRSLVTGQRSDAKRSSMQQVNMPGECVEDNLQKEVPLEVRVAPTVKVANHRSKRSDIFVESFKQAELHRDGKVRLAHTRTLSSSHVPVKKSVSDSASVSLSSSFTAGVPTGSKHAGRKGDTPGGTKDGDILTSIMNASTKTHQIDPRPTKDRFISQALSSPAFSRVESSSPSHHAEKDGKDNQTKRVHFDLPAPGSTASTFSPDHNNAVGVRGILKSQPSSRAIPSNQSGGRQTSTTRGTPDVRSMSLLTVQSQSSNQRANPAFGSPDKKAANMVPSKELSSDQFLGWVLNWDVDLFTEHRTNPSSILKGCDYKKLLKVPTSFASIDEFYQVFLPMKMMQIWNEIHFAFQKLRSDQLPIGALVETWAFKVLNENFKQCRFTVSMATNADGSASTVHYPKQFDLVILKRDDSNDFRPVLGIVLDSTLYSTPGMYSVSGANELRLWIRLRGIVNLKGNSFKIQVVTSLSSHINQFIAFQMFPKNVLASSILSPTRKDVFCGNDSYPLSDKIYKKTYHNFEQEAFVKSAFYCIQESYGVPRICMLQGPPCSGKTRTLATLVACLLRHSSLQSNSGGVKPKILVCAPSDHALDVLISHIWKVLRKDHPTERSDSRRNVPANLNHFILRIGDEECVEQRYRLFVMEKIVKDNKAKYDNHLKDIRTLIGELDMKEQSLDASIQYNKTIPKKHNSVEKLKMEKEEVKRRRKEEEDRLDRGMKVEFNANKTRDELIVKADVICCKIQDVSLPILQTLLRKPADDPWSISFSCAIIDEACQCLEVDTILPLYSAITKLVLAGDPHELKHRNIPQISSRYNLNQSLFTRLVLNFQGSLCHPVRKLTEQHWCHPEIFSFPNRTFYNGSIKNSRNTLRTMSTKLMPYLVFNLCDSAEKAVSESEWINEAEVKLVQNLVQIIHREGYKAMSIAILSPYKEQARQLREQIPYFPGLYIGNIKGLQGKMKEIVIISCVRTRESSHSLGFLDDYSKVNIALTRASYSAFIIGNFEVLPQINTLWSNLFQDAVRRNLYVKIPQMYIGKLSDNCLKNRYQKFQAIREQRREAASARGGERMVEPSPPP